MSLDQFQILPSSSELDGNERPWVKVGDAETILRSTNGANSVAAGCRYHSLFAGHLRFVSTDASEQRWSGRINNTNSKNVLERQRLFIEAQRTALFLSSQHHSGDPLRTLVMRCYKAYGEEELRLVLIGKCCARDPKLAQQAALQYWSELKLLLPYDYDLVPVVNEEEFQVTTGWTLLDSLKNPDQLVEVRRFESALPIGRNHRVYLLGSWNCTPISYEQIWRTLAAAPGPILLNVAIQPVVLSEKERLTLSELISVTQQTAADSRSPIVQREAQWAARSYIERLGNWRRSFLVRLHIAARSGVPDSVYRAIGSAVTFSHTEEQSSMGYRIQMSQDENRLSISGKQLRWLELNTNEPDTPDPRFTRMRFMADGRETHAVFRWPLLNGDTKGVTFY